MGIYAERILPLAIDFVCGTRDIARQREKVVPQACGRVLEIGMGAAHNLAFYDPGRVEMVWGLEPSAGMRRRAASRVAAAPFEVRMIDLPGEEIPLDDDSVDTVVLTYTLCSIPDWRTALTQMRRVLKPGGKLLFCEHGTAPEAGVRRWQERLDPVWQRIAGGCHLNRAIPDLIEQSGFGIDTLEQGYTEGTRRYTRFAGYHYWGAARIR